jgi:hypothetical protein
VNDIPTPVVGAAAVRFDPSAALALAAALDDLAWHLDRTRAAESGAFERAAADWRGHAAVWAARQRPELTEPLQRLARRCEDAAAAARASIRHVADLAAQAAAEAPGP